MMTQLHCDEGATRFLNSAMSWGKRLVERLIALNSTNAVFVVAKHDQFPSDIFKADTNWNNRFRTADLNFSISIAGSSAIGKRLCTL